MLHMKLLSTEN